MSDLLKQIAAREYVIVTMKRIRKDDAQRLLYLLRDTSVETAAQVAHQYDDLDYEEDIDAYSINEDLL